MACAHPSDALSASTFRESLWRSVERIVANADPYQIRIHKLGPLAAWYLRQRQEPVPSVLATAERGASVVMLAAAPLLERIRSSCEGPLVLIKGPELALRYPGHSRYFFDLDLLAPDAWAVHRALQTAGFVDISRPSVDYRHHLRPLKWPALGLTIEIHKRPHWPKRLQPPSLDEILEAALPCARGVDGILTPDPRHHALIIAAHAWSENPLGTMRDLIDIAALCAEASERELERTAHDWGLGRVWTATCSTIQAVVEGGRLPLPARLWARHLESLRERTVVEALLCEWLQGFWKLPPLLAWMDTRDALTRHFRRRAGEPWRAKLIRSADAVRHPQQPHSLHDREVRKLARAEEARD